MSPARPLVEVERITGPLRTRTDLVAGLGGDLSFYRWAANAPKVAEFYWGAFYRDLFFRGSLPVRLKELIRLRLAGLTGCAFCSAGDRASALVHGITADEVDAAFAGDADTFADEQERAALHLARAVADGLPAGDVDSLLACFVPEQAVELAMVAGVLAGVGRMLVATGFVPSVCPAPGARRPALTRDPDPSAGG